MTLTKTTSHDDARYVGRTVPGVIRTNSRISCALAPVPVQAPCFFRLSAYTKMHIGTLTAIAGPLSQGRAIQ